eukprot:4904388-Prymnesium_polylepis.1
MNDHASVEKGTRTSHILFRTVSSFQLHLQFRMSPVPAAHVPVPCAVCVTGERVYGDGGRE